MAKTKTRSPRARGVKPEAGARTPPRARAVKPEAGARTPPRARAAVDPDEALRQELAEQRAAEPADKKDHELGRQSLLRILQRAAEPADKKTWSLSRMLKAHGIDPAQWIALPRDARDLAFEKAGRERFKAWCAERGATPKEMGERLSSDEELRGVTEIDNATDDLMKALNRLHKLGLSAAATTKWVKFHTDLRWRYGGDDGNPHELPTLVRFIERTWSIDSGLRLAGSDETRRKRKSDFNKRIVALRDAVSDSEWSEVTRTKLALALELLREAGNSPASCGDAESVLEYMCTMLGLDVSRRNSRAT